MALWNFAEITDKPVLKIVNDGFKVSANTTVLPIAKG
jgi:hypothetical protein